jgi:YD repeat-containing protein
VDRLRHSLSVQQTTSPAWSESYGYDGANRLTNITSPAGAFSYVYDPGLAGNPTSSGLIDQLSIPTGAKITNRFDVNGRKTSTLLKNGSTTLDSYVRTFNTVTKSFC